MLPHYDELTDRPVLSKEVLVDGAYYIGRCRNATVARWNAKQGSFFHWCVKFGRIYIEEIKHPIDEEYFDVFRVVRQLLDPKFEIPFEAVPFQGRVEDLDEYSREMWNVSGPVA